MPAAPTKPCHGPHCSGGHPTPLPPVAPPTLTGDERWGQPADADPPSEPTRSTILLASTSERPIHRTAEVFHPPRLS